MFNRPFKERAVFAFGYVAESHRVSLADLLATEPALQAQAWDAYADGYAAHAHHLMTRLVAADDGVGPLKAELVDAQAQVRAARAVAAALRAPLRRPRRAEASQLVAI